METQRSSHPSLFIFLLCACLAIAFIGGIRTNAATPSALLKDAKVADADKKLFHGDCQTDPYSFLLTRYTPGTVSSREGKNGILGLNADFACRLSIYLTKRPHIKIISAYRSVESQTSLWKSALAKYGSAEKARKWVAPPGNSMHNKGLAADLTGVGEQDRLSAPEDKLHFRVAHEGWHIEPLGAVSGGPGVKNPEGGALPTAGPADSLRKIFGGDQPSAMPQPTPQMQPAPAAQPAIPQQQGSVQTGQVFGTPATSGSAPTGATVPVIATPSLANGSSSPTFNTPAQSLYSSSVTDQLLQLAYDTPLGATSTVVATSVPLTIDGSDVGGVETDSNETVGSTTSASTAYGAPGTTLPSTNTFVSTDIAGGPYEVVASYRGEPTGFVGLLVQLRDAFAALLNILRPMGIREAIAPSHMENEEEFMELEYDPVADFQSGVNEGGTLEIVVD